MPNKYKPCNTQWKISVTVVFGKSNSEILRKEHEEPWPVKTLRFYKFGTRMPIHQYWTFESLKVESIKDSYTFNSPLHCMRKWLASKEWSPKPAHWALKFLKKTVNYKPNASLIDVQKEEGLPWLAYKPAVVG